MSDAGLQGKDDAVTAADLLAYDEDQLTSYMTTQDRGTEFDVSNLVGVEALSSTQRDDLMRKLSKAASLLPLAIDELQARLEKVPMEREDNPHSPVSPPYHFAASLQLRKDPQKQTAWTDWLEYLSFELMYLEDLTIAAESLEMEYHQAMDRLLRTRITRGNKATSTLAASKSTHSRQCGQRKEGENRAKDLAEARADRDASHQSIDDFIEETKSYREASRAAFHQRHRVEWIVKEARLMEAEIALQSSLTKSKKRKQRDGQSPEPRPKGSKREIDSISARSAATPGKSRPRRSTRQSKRSINMES